jgi:enamine deaminase RidA (YjgF/YER057c/UK114 family)
MPIYKNNICVNPITWRNEGTLSDFSDAKGAVYVSGEFALDFIGDDGPKGQIFGPLEAPLKEYVQAQCKNGLLFTSDQTGTKFQAFGGSEGNYHGLDYALFYMDIRENAKLKVKTYLDNFSQ